VERHEQAIFPAVLKNRAIAAARFARLSSKVPLPVRAGYFRQKATNPVNDARFIAIFAHAWGAPGVVRRRKQAGGGDTAAGRGCPNDPTPSPVVSEQLAVRSAEDAPTPSWQFSQREGDRGQGLGPTSICLPSFPIWGRRTMGDGDNSTNDNEADVHSVEVVC